jgi:putative RNA 2'-phosphotransferase
MLSPARLTKLSKYLSYHLRHHPDALGLTLAPGGWVEIDVLLSASHQQGFKFDRCELEEVVAKNDKQRFSIDSTRSRIRANQGHSVPVDLELEPQTPPNPLYHGTPDYAVKSILCHGLQKMSRHHVHLCTDIKQAQTVGQRRGRPRVLIADTAAMTRDGYSFYCSDNGVWLVDAIPPQYLTLIE